MDINVGNVFYGWLNVIFIYVRFIFYLFLERVEGDDWLKVRDELRMILGF